METTKQIITTKVKLVKGGICINYKKYRDSYWDTFSVMTPALKEPPSTMKNPTGAEHPEFLATQTWEAVQHLLDETEKYIGGKRAQGNLFESDTK